MFHEWMGIITEKHVDDTHNNSYEDVNVDRDKPFKCLVC